MSAASSGKGPIRWLRIVAGIGVIVFIADRLVSGAPVRLLGPLLVFLAALATSDAWALYAVFPGAAIALFVEAAWHFVYARA